MGFMLSPGVQVTEKDFTSIVPAVATSTGAFAGVFQWGPVMDPTTITSENELVHRFGGPNTDNATSFYTAANFLSYANNLLLVRVDTDDQKNAVAMQSGGVTEIEVTDGGAGYLVTPTVTISAPDTLGGVQATATAVLTSDEVTSIVIVEAGTGYTSAPTVTIAPGPGTPATATATVTLGGLKINNESTYDVNYSHGAGAVGAFAAKYPGTIGNSIKISMADGSEYATWAYKDEFDSAPDADELHVIIIDATGKITGVDEGVLEKYAYLSKASDAKKSDGATNYYKNVLNSSKWIYWMDHPTNTNWGTEEFGADFTTMSEAVETPAELSITTVNGTGGITAVAIDEGGAGYGSNTRIVITSAGGTGAVLTPVIVDGVIDSVTITSAGAGYLDDDVITVFAGALTVQLSGGTDDFEADDGELMNGFSLFDNAETYDISLVMAGKASQAVAIHIINNVVETRRDCVAFISAQHKTTGEPIVGIATDLANDIVDFRNDLPSTSYAVIDSGYKYQYDRYNDVYRWIPLNGDIAGLCARTDYTDDPWFSPGGYNRGQVKNAVKLAFNPNRAARDILYKSGVNPVVSFPGEGTVLFGDKTMLAKPSAFDRINVRRLFIVLEKAIAIAAKYQLFEFNDKFTRAIFKSMIEPFLRDVQGRRGLYDFKVVCDETNNTGEVIDSNRFIADIYLKPARSINFITLNFIAVRTAVSFEEIGA